MSHVRARCAAERGCLGVSTRLWVEFLSWQFRGCRWTILEFDMLRRFACAGGMIKKETFLSETWSPPVTSPSDLQGAGSWILDPMLPLDPGVKAGSLSEIQDLGSGSCPLDPGIQGQDRCLFLTFSACNPALCEKSRIACRKSQNKTSILPLDPGIQGQDPPPKSGISEDDPAFTPGSRDPGARSYPLDPGIQGQDPGS